jgi:predicted ribosomally synthesized peptide with SipW-like signal peptide
MQINKKIVASLATIAVVTAAGIGGTIAYFSSTQTSHGNIIKSGKIDLKIDHTWQSYNSLDCNNFTATLVSDTNERVIATVGGHATSTSAVYVGSANGFIHSAWNATIDGCNPRIESCAAEWVWVTDPTLQADVTENVTYTFAKKFEWYGAVAESNITFAAGSDNTVKISLNGHVLDNDGLNHYEASETVTVDPSFLVNGDNELTFEVTNEGQPTGDYTTNPGGLLYKLTIVGNPDRNSDDYFSRNCRLWTSKHLGSGDRFFNFDDVKPGDSGTNSISVLVKSNPSWLCMGIDKIDADSTPGEVLSSNIQVMAWKNTNSEKEPTPGTNPIGPMSMAAFQNQGIYLPLLNGGATLQPGTKEYIHLLWCAGELSSAGVCNGANMTEGQGQKLVQDLIFHAEQSRNNGSFDCPLLDEVEETGNQPVES